MFFAMRVFCLAAIAVALTGCLTSSAPDAGRMAAIHPVSHFAAYVAAPPALAPRIRSSIVAEAGRRGLVAEDALALFPPSRSYVDADIRQVLAARAVDGVLIINVGETGVPRQFAKTMFRGPPVAPAAAASVAAINGDPSSTSFTAELIEPAGARSLWNGSGIVDTGGAFSEDDGSGAALTIGALFDELQRKGFLAQRSASEPAVQCLPPPHAVRTRRRKKPGEPLKQAAACPWSPAGTAPPQGPGRRPCRSPWRLG
jgi:hypothetical protein